MMRLLSRRAVLSLLMAAVGAMGLISGAVSASSEASNTELATDGSIARFQVGNAEVIALSDGTFPIDLFSVLQGLSADQVQAYLDQTFEINPVETSITAFLVRMQGHLMLVDTGCGTFCGDVGGKLLRSLALTGYSPEDITDVLITHMHGDHEGGLALHGKRAFPNAVVYIHQADIGRFLNPDNLRDGVIRQLDWDRAQASVALYRAAGQLKTSSGPTQLLPGIKAIPMAGHTPGATFYQLHSAGEQLYLIGDMIHIRAVQLPAPEVTVGYDLNPSKARAERLKWFQTFAQEGALLAAPHMNFPGVGHLRVQDQGYRWIPAAYHNR
ncbi:MBL fold metallo-hydrolase [Terasakiispira papahanaumokuakeensis]|nr:MBL fold metallo-hydrolase [Terasakiispira papahanaumokuakeensis]